MFLAFCLGRFWGWKRGVRCGGRDLTFTDGVAKLILIGLLEYFEWEVHFCRQGLILRTIRALAWWRLPHLVMAVSELVKVSWMKKKEVRGEALFYRLICLACGASEF